MFYLPGRVFLSVFVTAFLFVPTLQAQDETTPPTAPPPLPAGQWINPEESDLISPEVMAELSEIKEFMHLGDGVAGQVGRAMDGYDATPYGYAEELPVSPAPEPEMEIPQASESIYDSVFSSRMMIIPRHLHEIPESQLPSKDAKRIRIELMISNLLHADLPGYKAATFSSLGAGVPPIEIIEYGGKTESSSSPHEFAIVGEGFLRIRSKGDGVQYTRCGQLWVTDDLKLGVLIRDDEFPFDPPIDVSSGSGRIFITPSGQVALLPSPDDESTNSNPEILGRIQLSLFSCGMKPVGICRYVPSDPECGEQCGTPGEGEFGRIRPFAYEKSNVDVPATKQALIEAIEAYHP